MTTNSRSQPTASERKSNSPVAMIFGATFRPARNDAPTVASRPRYRAAAASTSEPICTDRKSTEIEPGDHGQHDECDDRGPDRRRDRHVRPRAGRDGEGIAERIDERSERREQRTEAERDPADHQEQREVRDGGQRDEQERPLAIHREDAVDDVADAERTELRCVHRRILGAG